MGNGSTVHVCACVCVCVCVCVCACESMYARLLERVYFCFCVDRSVCVPAHVFVSHTRQLSTASCGLIQVFFIVSYAQFFQNTFILARKLLNPTLWPSAPYLLFTNVGVLRL